MKTLLAAGILLLIGVVGCSNDDSTSVSVDQTLRAPTNVAVTRIGLTSVRVNWTDNNETEEGYIVERQAGSGQFAQQVFVASDATSAVDSVGLVANTTYGYRVRAIRYSERGEYSPVVTIRLALPYP
jgi:outer membrane lipoprotein SlyB